MIYLDNGATSFHKPAAVRRAVLSAMKHCANPGRGGHVAAMTAADTVYRCRELAGEFQWNKLGGDSIYLDASIF